ncbi:DUF2187 domain-containing protein [Vagococcus penaei]|uniref:DUF2187 domain-containing protein n=1 Tax=Vagococcus penaei TaxID=633807 RepID=A0A1Q2D4X1_9ENTE|nr:DUF2187 domain-containing protein [Vagococcus penaei]AQP53433.1 DUF2187 domain-containing protein [Vagococcus penaei]RSU00822.1 DUF2187 domain-containing protein [Vagococcus penaei]
MVESKILFKWQNEEFEGNIEKEYDHSYLISVANPNEELRDKYLSRIVISKKACQLSTRTA